MEYYLIHLWGGVDIKIFGPFSSSDSRDNIARELRKEHGQEHGYFSLEVTKGSKIKIDCYSGTFFEDEDENKNN
jgi:hypothetical protein